MLKRLRDKLSEKTKLIIYICITVGFFLTACFLPLAFKGRGEGGDEYFDNGARAAMFLGYHNKSSDVQCKVLDGFSSADEKYCSGRASEISSFCRLDKKSGKKITDGTEYLQLSDGENTLRIYHTWLQDEGDWTNWLDLYFDADTGFVYYIYVSSVCLNNSSDYISALDSSFNSRFVANLIAEQTGFTLKHFSWSGNAEDTAYAVTSNGGDTVCWNINCSYYESTMLDVKIIVA